jgi:adenylate cyclase
MRFPLRQPRTANRPPRSGLIRRRPLLAFFLLALFSNLFGSVFNILYNLCLIVAVHLNPAQRAAFPHVLWAYNLIAYPVCLLWLLCLLRPLARCLRSVRAGAPIAAPELERCRRQLVDLPWQVVCLNFLGWAPGAVVFPLGICLLAGWDNAGHIWLHFVVSFLVSALLTTVQTFFLLEWFLVEFVYAEFFHDARPAAILGAFRLRLAWRLFFYWVAVAIVPLVSLLAVALNFTTAPEEQLPLLNRLALGVALCGLLSSGLISWLVSRNLVSWLDAHAAATEEITLGNFAYRIRDQRPDEFGRLTDHFNDMAFQLGRGEQVHEQMGQMVGPDMRDFILEHCPALDGWVQETTVLFIDIRGFTRRSAGEPPERVVELLNRFLSLAVAAIKEQRGWTDKFLGDGLMALFNTPDPLPDHADRAVQAALDLLHGLEHLNAELAAQGQAPLVIGCGIHTGPAVVGCIGATIALPDGRKSVRKAFTAIGETVNLAQRMEQLTKQHGGPILLSEQTRARLRHAAGYRLVCLGPTAVPGFADAVTIHRVEPYMPGPPSIP